MRRCIYKKIHYLTFDLDLRVKVTRNVTQYPLHHVIYASTKFEVATSNGLEGDTITRNVTDGRTDRQTDGQTHRRTDGRRTDFGTKLIYPIFLTKKRVKKIYPLQGLVEIMVQHRSKEMRQSHDTSIDEV